MTTAEHSQFAKLHKQLVEFMPFAKMKQAVKKRLTQIDAEETSQRFKKEFGKMAEQIMAKLNEQNAQRTDGYKHLTALKETPETEELLCEAETRYAASQMFSVWYDTLNLTVLDLCEKQSLTSGSLKLDDRFFPKNMTVPDIFIGDGIRTESWEDLWLSLTEHLALADEDRLKFFLKFAHQFKIFVAEYHDKHEKKGLVLDKDNELTYSVRYDEKADSYFFEWN